MSDAGCELVMRLFLIVVLIAAIILLLGTIILVLMFFGSTAESGQAAGTLTSAAGEFFIQLTAIVETAGAP